MDSSNDIVKLGEDLARALVQAAEDQLAKAQSVLDQAKSMADIILNQVNDEARKLDDMNARYKASTEKMLEGYRILDGKKAAPVEAPRSQGQGQGLLPVTDPRAPGVGLRVTGKPQ